MSPELEKVCRQLAMEQFKPYLDDHNYDYNSDSRFAFELGFQAAIESEQVKALVEALKYYTQYPSPFTVCDELWDQGLRVQTKARKALEAWEGEQKDD